MVTFRSNNNNNRRPPFRTNNNRRPPFRGNNEGSKFSNNDNFQRKIPGRNNHNAVKLIEKYNEMAREALANEDRVLSENYFQHADHFTRVQNEQESIRIDRVNSSPAGTVKPIETVKPAEVDVKNEKLVKTEKEVEGKVISEPEVKKIIKTIEKKTAEKKSIAS
ncbi:DUF4167 domain-containing protein [Candidatus Pelagibacter sp.]|jgi:hypothetical protein|nr:DUF4167 domain-containing protein [Candidatus Pelagibacter sp.]